MGYYAFKLGKMLFFKIIYKIAKEWQIIIVKTPKLTFNKSGVLKVSPSHSAYVWREKPRLQWEIPVWLWWASKEELGGTVCDRLRVSILRGLLPICISLCFHILGLCMSNHVPKLIFSQHPLHTSQADLSCAASVLVSWEGSRSRWG